jgi:hypothetical protein
LGKIGRYEYPELGLEETIEVGRVVADNWGGEVSRSALAKSLGMSERGGAFAARLGATRLWGVCTGRGTVRLTDDGLSAAKPRSPDEAEEARKNLAGAVPLFVEVAKRAGTRVMDENRLRMLLEEITGANRLEVDRRAPLLTRLVNETLVYYRTRTSEEAEHSTPERTTPEDVRPVARLSGEDRIELTLPDGHLSVPESISGIEAAMLLLQTRREKLLTTVSRSSDFTPPERPF